MTTATALWLRRDRVVAFVLALVVLKAGMAAALLTLGERAAAQQVATPLEVVTDYAAPQLSVKATASGVALNWTFNAATTTPPGWRLSGFSGHRRIAGRAGSLVFFKTFPNPAARSFTDGMAGVPERQRYPGTKFSYAIYAIYTRISDGAKQVGKSAEVLFKTPNLPKARNFSVSTQLVGSSTGGYIRNLLSWEQPHLAWDSSTGLHEVSQYIIYGRSSNEVVNGSETSFRWLSDRESYNGACTHKFKIRARYGIFFSKLASAGGDRGVLCD